VVAGAFGTAPVSLLLPYLTDKLGAAGIFVGALIVVGT
jgi:hypothetical protein